MVCATRMFIRKCARIFSIPAIRFFNEHIYNWIRMRQSFYIDIIERKYFLITTTIRVVLKYTPMRKIIILREMW